MKIRMKKIYLVLILYLSVLSCTSKMDNGVLCACYIFPTNRYAEHYYMEINKNRKISISIGQGSDIIEKLIHDEGDISIGKDTFISRKSYFKEILLNDSTNELVGYNYTDPQTIVRYIDLKKYEAIVEALKNIEHMPSCHFQGKVNDGYGVILITNTKYYEFYNEEVKTEEKIKDFEYVIKLTKMILSDSPIQDLL